MPCCLWWSCPALLPSQAAGEMQIVIGQRRFLRGRHLLPELSSAVAAGGAAESGGHLRALPADVLQPPAAGDHMFVAEFCDVKSVLWQAELECCSSLKLWILKNCAPDAVPRPAHLRRRQHLKDHSPRQLQRRRRTRGRRQRQEHAFLPALGGPPPRQALVEARCGDRLEQSLELAFEKAKQESRFWLPFSSKVRCA